MIWHGDTRPDLCAMNTQISDCAISHLGIELSGAGDDWLRARMPVDARTRQPFGVLHGGASVLLIETLASMASLAVLDPSAKRAAGVEVNANHVRPIAQGWVVGTARPDALGRTLHVWSVRIEDDGGRLISTGRCTLAVITAN